MRKENEKKLNKYLPVVIGKDLAEARFTMDLWERRLMYACMSKIKNDDTEFKTITFTIADIAKLMDQSSLPGQDYEAIKKAARKLVTRVVEVNEKGNYEIYNWVSYFKLDKAENEITMQFNEYMKPHLLYLLENKGYTKFLLKFAMPLGSTYAQRFYEMFRCLVYDGQTSAVKRIELAELRKRLEMPEKQYQNFHLFKLRVLDIAEREINQKTDIYVGFKEIRRKTKGRAVIALMISVMLKANMLHEWDSFMLWQKDDLLEKLFYIVQRAKGQKIDTELFEKYSHESIARLTYEANEGKIDLLKINNCQAFIEWQLKQWQSDIGMNQYTIEDWANERGDKE